MKFNNVILASLIAVAVAPMSAMAVFPPFATFNGLVGFGAGGGSSSFTGAYAESGVKGDGDATQTSRAWNWSKTKIDFNHLNVPQKGTGVSTSSGDSYAKTTTDVVGSHNDYASGFSTAGGVAGNNLGTWGLGSLNIGPPNSPQ